MSTSHDSRQSDLYCALDEIVKNLKFSKVNSVIYMLPGFLLFISLLFITAGLSTILEQVAAGNEETDPLLGSSMGVSYIQWGIVTLLGYAVSAMIASYRLTNDLRRHLYESSVATYYFLGGSDRQGLFQYLQSMYSRSELPSPITALVMALLTLGFSYPILIYISESKLREHSVVEEKSLLGKVYTSGLDATRLVLDIVLLFISLGLYLVYMALRFAKSYNRHYELIHISHPSPPSNTEVLSSGGRNETNPYPALLVLLLGGGLINVIAHRVGIYHSLFFSISLGLLISYTALITRNRSIAVTFIAILAIIYTTCILGYLNGYINHQRFEFLYGNFENQTQRVTRELIKQGLPYLSMYIFNNNFAISIPAIVPYAGGLFVGIGAYNAGLVLGVLSSFEKTDPLRVFSVLFYPHAILELSAYAVLATSSRFVLIDSRKFFKIVLIGAVILITAAFIESYTILAKIS